MGSCRHYLQAHLRLNHIAHLDRLGMHLLHHLLHHHQYPVGNMSTHRFHRHLRLQVYLDIHQNCHLRHRYLNHIAHFHLLGMHPHYYLRHHHHRHIALFIMWECIIVIGHAIII